jgi:methylmalonic acid semialdehyde dehydrogenase
MTTTHEDNKDPIPPTIVDHFIHGSWVAPSSGQYLDVTNPATDQVIARVAIGNASDVETAIEHAKTAQKNWGEWTVKARAAILLKFHYLIQQHAQEIAQCIVTENGKNITEAMAEVAKANETVEYACSLVTLMPGKTLQVSSNVTCHELRTPIGVVASIVPFNFPLMVPMWTVPIALVTGNAVLLKPSEKVPLTLTKTIALWQQAGLPPGVLQYLQGTAETVRSIITHPHVQAVTFVGSSNVAEIVSTTCRARNLRCTALGGAKNHLVAIETDTDILEETAHDVVVSFAGCAGQRCMAASVLLLVRNNNNNQEEQKQLPALLQRIVELAVAVPPGHGPGQMGPVIDAPSYQKIIQYIQTAENDGATILLDGRTWNRHHYQQHGGGGGNWIGPTILLHHSKSDATLTEEVFGPVLSVFYCSDIEEAIAMENDNAYGNAASIYTPSGAVAEHFCRNVRAAMLGVNIGIPVPREPFSFGGLYGTRSKFGDMDITGDGALEFFTHRIKISTKWPISSSSSSLSSSVPKKQKTTTSTTTDRANFAGSM